MSVCGKGGTRSSRHLPPSLGIKCPVVGLVLGREWVKNLFSLSLVLLSGSCGGGLPCLAAYCFKDIDC